MILQYISEIITKLTSERIAEIFTEPIAILIVFSLIIGLFTIFSDSATRRILLIFNLVVVGAFALFNMASHFGFIQLPVVMGG